MAFQIRDLVSDVWFDEADGYLLAGCTQPSCGKSSDDGDGDGDGDDKGGHKGGHPGDHKEGDKKDPKKYAPEAGLALLQQQLRQSLAQEL
jgi:hypothetical protein